MAIPKQVQQLETEVGELEKQLYDVKAQPTDPDKPVAEVYTPEAEQRLDEPAKTVEAAPQAKEEPVDTKGEKDVDWRQKYKTLQGMYDAEVPRLHQQLRELTAELSKVKQTVEVASKEAEVAKEQAEYERLKNLVTDEDRKEFGEDLIEVQRKVAREETADLLRQFDELRSENAKLHELLNQTGSQVTQTTFQQRLYQLVPDFEQVNTDPNWIKWLDEQDPLLRAPRRVIAEKAYSEGDADAVAHFVNLFRGSATPSTTEAPSKSIDRELESQIQPSKNASPSATASPKGNIYSSEQIRQMFLKVTQLGKLGRIDEARKLEAEIDAAYMQGRVSG